MQARRIAKKNNKSLIKKATKDQNSIWKNRTLEIMKEYEIKEDEQEIRETKLKNRIKTENRNRFLKQIREEATTKSKVNHWLTLKEQLEQGRRPMYITKLNRKQCRAIIKTRCRMPPVKDNQPENHVDVNCRKCDMKREIQQHILQEC